MLPVVPLLAVPLGLFARGVNGWPQHDGDEARHHPSTHARVAAPNTTLHDAVTVFDTKTVEVTHYVDVSINRTITNIVEETVTECTTTTLNATVWVTQTAIQTVYLAVTDTELVRITNTATDSTTIINTETDSTTVVETATDLTTVTNTDTDSVTVTNTDTDSVTITNTETDSVTITNTATTTETVPTTTYTTHTLYSTTYDPCPKLCSISVDTVNLYFWPTNRPYTYPSTYVHPTLGYTFTSPSVYMLIPTAVGINSAGERTGPSTTSWLLPLDLYQVSTIAPALLPRATGTAGTGGDSNSNITRQLTLADLGTDCPQTADPTAIATIVDPRCDPVLAAPEQVRRWAYPCNACGRFGMFDPPYAVPTLTGGLVETTTVGTATSEVVVMPPTATATATAVVNQTPTSIAGAGTGPAVTGTAGTAGAGQPSAGDGSSGTGVTAGGAADPGANTAGASGVVGSGSVSVGASSTAPPVTAAGARSRVGGGVTGLWCVLGMSFVVFMF